LKFLTHFIICPRFFSQTKYASFQRQLNLYGFSRKRAETSLSCYYHPCFLREDPDLVRNMVRCKIKGTGKNRQGSPQPKYNKKKGGQRASTQPPPLELPPVTPTRMVSNSSASSSSSDDEDAESVVTTPEPHSPKSNNIDLLPLVGSSYTTYYYDDINDFMAHHDQTEEEMGFFDGSPFHLLEHELIGSMMDHDSGTAHRHHHSTLAMAPTLPYASFRADGTGMQPRMKLQPRSLSSSGADFMAGFIL
jgi:HSF-type DNA-binding